MSKKNKRSNNSTYVGRLNFKEVKNDIDLEIDISENLYKKFCDDYAVLVFKNFQKLQEFQHHI